ncbi:aminoglycoside N(3)-acetyltransferase [Actinoplanes couchii]|uniref:Aminoglycoside N(3)-acetyltransferase n=1 Tax=Actinoplanes couchii TaxID=403638 RepID=A0ABQ3XPL8_9ACTN|nr:AAC(3) family N-acetyltransferase [Actinoplanes couchii]MDR6319085.1 aminoglycoside 3-N-acetyltransferase [Actinoplanes couchii]GID60428.1 AAC(3) family N-acetyltransferase [Actinoplanes couchii]
MTQETPYTTASLAADLRGLGLAAGDVVLVHSALKAVGFVVGQAQAVVEALLQVLGPDGTLVVPTHTPDNSDPATWEHPPVPESWWPVIREQAPGFDPLRTPSRWMGVLAETVRTWPGAVRSSHPETSFAALGPLAAAVTAGHPPAEALGEGSPLGAVYRANGKVLLIGCDHGNNTSLHLAECRVPDPLMEEHGAAVRNPDGTSSWLTWTAPVDDESDFDEIGRAYEKSGPVCVGRVGNAESRLMPQRALVDFGVAWMIANRAN